MSHRFDPKQPTHCAQCARVAATLAKHRTRRLRVGDRVFELAAKARHMGRSGYVLNPRSRTRDGRSRLLDFVVGPGRVLVGWSNGDLSTHERRELMRSPIRRVDPFEASK